MHTQTHMHTHSHSHTDPLQEPSVKTGLYCQVAWGTSQAWMRDVTILCDLSQGSDTFSLRCHCCCSKMMYLQALLLIFQNPLKTRGGCLCSTAPFRSHQIDRPFLRDSEERKNATVLFLFQNEIIFQIKRLNSMTHDDTRAVTGAAATPFTCGFACSFTSRR